MSYTFTPDPAKIAAIHKQTEELYYRKYKETLECEVTRMFQRRLTSDGGREYQAEGEIRTLIREQVEAFYLDMKTQDRARAYIDEAFTPALKSCIEDAIKHAVRRKEFKDLVSYTQGHLEARTPPFLD